jgi:hypothetical protein
MHNVELRTGLRFLAKRGWEVVDINEEFFEFLCNGEGEQPSAEAKERFLTHFRARVDKAYGHKPKRSGSGAFETDKGEDSK